MKRWIYTAVFVAVAGLFCRGQELDTLSLQDCLRQGLENNFSVLISRNDQQIASNNATWGNAGYLPSVDLSAGYNGSLDTYRDVPRSGDPASRYHPNTHNLNAGVDLDWTFFQGFKISATYDKLRELEKQGELSTRISMENTAGDIAVEYYNFIYQRARLHTLQVALSLSRERLRIVEARNQIGTMSRLELQQARVDYYADSSRYTQQRVALQTSGITLNRLMAREDVNRPLALADTSITIGNRLDYSHLQQFMADNNPYLLMVQSNIRISEKDYKIARSRYYPDLSLYAGYGYNQYYYDAGTNKSRQDLGFGYGLRLGFNIFDGLNRRRENRNARIQMQTRDLEKQDMELSLRSDLSTAYASYVNYLELLEVERENLVTARENYAIAIERYKLGQLAGIDLREAQISLRDAEERLLNAQFMIKQCEISLQQISGNILSYLMG